MRHLQTKHDSYKITLFNDLHQKYLFSKKKGIAKDRPLDMGEISWFTILNVHNLPQVVSKGQSDTFHLGPT